MSRRVEQIYKSAKKNEEFISAFKRIDEDGKVPGIFADYLKRALFGCLYYGWCIARYGDNWRIKSENVTGIAIDETDNKV